MLLENIIWIILVIGLKTDLDTLLFLTISLFTKSKRLQSTLSVSETEERIITTISFRSSKILSQNLSRINKEKRFFKTESAVGKSQ